MNKITQNFYQAESKKIIYRLLCVFVLFFTVLNVNAATRNSVASGNLNAAATWGGTAPVNGDILIINSGHTVTVSSAFTQGLTTITIKNGGILTGGSNITLIASLTIDSGGICNATGNVITTGAISVSGSMDLTNGSSRQFTCGSLLVNSGGTCVTNANITVSGTTTITGSMTINTTASGRVDSFADIVLNSGASWTEAVGSNTRATTISGNFTNDATTFSVTNLGIFTFSGTGKVINGLTISSFPNVAFTGTSSIGSTSTFAVTTALTGAGTLTNLGTLNIGGTSTITGLTATTVGNTVNYTGAGQTVKATAYDNLTLSGSGAKIITTGTTITGNLIVSGTASANITTGGIIPVKSLTLGGSVKATGTSYGGTGSGAADVTNTTYFTATTSGNYINVPFSAVITGTAATTAFTTTYGTSSAVQSFPVSGTGLTTSITATAPTGFEVSSDGIAYGNTASFAQTGGNASGTLYIRLTANALVSGTYNSVQVALTSTGAATKYITTVSSGNVISAKALTMSGLSVPASKVYDGNTSAVVSGSPVLLASEAFNTGTSVDGRPYTGDVVSIAGAAVGTYNSKDVASATTVTYSGLSLTGAAAGNYTLTIQSPNAATITAKALTISGITVDNKVEDGTTTATLSGTPSLVGVVGADVVTIGGTYVANFSQTTPGTGLPVTVSGYVIGGSDVANYSLTQPTGLIADIVSVTTPIINSALTASATYGVAAAIYTVTATNTPTSFSASGLPSGLSINASTGDITGTATVAPGVYNVTIGATNALAETGTATLVYTIAAKNLTVSGAIADNKIYDRTNVATISGAVLVGIVGGDIVTLTGGGTFANVNVSTGISVTAVLSLGGGQAGFYTLTQPTGLTADITPKALTVSGAVVTSKTYTGTNPATITGAALVGIIAPDVVTVSGGGTFVSVNVGTGISVTAALSLGGAQAGNYSVTQPTVTGNITTAPLTITGLTAGAPSNKPYDGTTTATIGGTAAYSGLQNGETFSVTGTPSVNFIDKNVGVGKSIIITGYTAPSSNYSITQPTGLTADITIVPLTITASNQTVGYGTAVATVTGAGTYTATGLVGGETTAVLGGTAAYATTYTASSAIGTAGLTITPSGLTSANYTITFANGTITVIIGSQIINLAATASVYVNFADYAPATSATSATNPITYVSSNPAVATIVNNKIHYIGVGVTTITASQAASANYNAATPVNQTLTVLANLVTKKNVLYATLTKTLTGTGASLVTDDPIIRMLSADPNFNVTVVATDATGSTLPSLSGFDLVIVQESFGGTNGVLSNAAAGGKLAIKNLTVPVIYNKSFALQNARAVSSAGATVSDTSFLSVDVTGNATNTLYNGIDVSSNSVPLFKTTSDDQGSTSATGKGISIVNNLELSTTGTLKATVTSITNVNKAILINDIPSGTQLGTTATDVLPSRMIAFGFNFGAICESNGKNVTNEFLTIWRNAAYMLTSQPVPANLHINPDNNQRITFGALADKIWDDAAFNLTATVFNLATPPVSSGLTITYTSSNTAVATIAGSTVTIVGPGTTTITASQPGPGNPVYWYAAENVTQTLNVLDSTTWTTGLVWTHGTPTATKSTIVLGAYSTTSGVFTAKNLTVRSGGSLTIKSGDSVTVQDEVVNNASTIIIEDTGSLVQVNDAAVNTGNIIYNRNTTVISNMDYTYWSSPVVGFTLGGVSPDTAGDKFYSFDSSIENWQQESAATLMNPGVGYIVRGPQTAAYMFPNPPSLYPATFTGVPHNGHYQITGVIADKSYLLGNPYPSALDADAFLLANQNVLDGTLYFWTHNTPIGTGVTNPGSGTYSYSGDDYASYNGVGGTATLPAASPGINANIPSGKIASGQGFFASSSVAPTGTTIDYYNNMRVGVGGITGNNSQFFKTKNSKATSAVEKHRIWLDLTNDQGIFKQTLVGYVTDATNDYDTRFDGESFDANKYADFYSINQNKKLVIQGRALPFDENDEVTLGYKTTIGGSLTIGIGQADGLLLNQEVFLEDKLTNTVTNLKNGSYTFTTAQGRFNNRFVLRYTDKTLGVDDVSFDENNVNIYKSNGVLHVNSGNLVIANVKVYDIQGRLIAEQKNVNTSTLTVKELKDTKQVLIVKVTSQEGKVVTKKVIN